MDLKWSIYLFWSAFRSARPYSWPFLIFGAFGVGGSTRLTSGDVFKDFSEEHGRNFVGFGLPVDCETPG